ncbi:MAG: hypothetical protein LBD36_00920 [Holosporales bacterium]|jgi:hypothetical protein|nr:hypothetical protein [Holosporales bacterium]
MNFDSFIKQWKKDLRYFIYSCSRLFAGMAKNVIEKRKNIFGKTIELNKRKESSQQFIKQEVLFLCDVCVIFFSLLALLSKYHFGQSIYSSGFLAKSTIVFTLLAVSTLSIFNVYGTLFQDINFRLFVRTITLPIGISTILFLSLMPFLCQLECMSIFIPILNFFLCSFLLLIVRIVLPKLHNALNFKNKRKKANSSKMNTLIVGAFDDVKSFVECKQLQPYNDFQYIAIVTIDRFDFGKYINNIPVIGVVDSIQNLVEDGQNFCQHVVIIGEPIDQAKVHKLMKMFKNKNISVTIPESKYI